MAARQAAQNRTIEVPTVEQVQEMLAEFEEILNSAASAEMDKDMRTARRIIDELTGGRIELYQMGERKKGCGWLQGRFRIDIISMVIGKLTGAHAVPNSYGVDVVIDYRDTRLIDEQSEKAKQLWDQGMLCKAIAREMGCLPCYVTKLLNYWFDSRDLPRPDNRRRSAELKKKQCTVPVFQRIAREVVRLMEEGLSNLFIARQLNVSDATIGKAITWWFKSRDLPVPTAADRRRMKLVRAKEMYDGGMRIKDIAAELDYTPRGLKLALEKYFSERGERMPDGRARRENTNADERTSGDTVNEAGDENDPLE